MKFIKLSIFALTMGLFIASCGSGEGTEGTAADSTTMEAAPEAEATPMETAPADTMMAQPADSAAPAAEPAH